MREPVSPFWKSAIDLLDNSNIGAWFSVEEHEAVKSDVFLPLKSIGGLSELASRWIIDRPRKRAPWQTHEVYFMAFAASVLLSSYARTVGSSSGWLAALAALLGSVTCGWGWLYARSLFVASSKAMMAPLRIVFFVVALQFASHAATVLGLGETAALRVMGSAIGMIGSTFILVTLAEVARRIPDTQNGPERRFQMSFAGGYMALLVLVFILRGAGEGSLLATHTHTVESLGALFALAGASIALRFRQRHPIGPKRTTARTARPVTQPTASERRLASRVETLLCQPNVYTQPSLKVAEVAAQLGEPDYLVSKVITQVLGQPNFNRYINRFRVEHAQTMLRDPEFRGVSILVIALDCGFASIGPFNRAFRQETGLSPSVYRQQQNNSR